MTRALRACYVFLCLCFLGVLVMMPDPSFFDVNNAYEVLPLYRYVKQQEDEVRSGADNETSRLITERNSDYVAAFARISAKPEETPSPVETPIPSQPPQNLKKKNDHEEKQPVRPAYAAIRPAPILDLSPARLADTQYLLNQFFIVDETTSADAVQLNAAEFLSRDLSIKKAKEEPQILIYHSHSQETFADSREGVQADTVVGVGSTLTRILERDYGYKVLHIKKAFDLMGGELDRSKAYDYARDYLEPVLKKHPSIQVIIDLHRDGVPENRHLVTEINKKPTAQIMFYNGLSYTISQGRVTYLPNPYIQDNLAFSFQLEYQAAQYYPKLYRGIYLAGLRYNLHLRPRCVLLEAGAQTNTVREVKNAMKPFADILDRVLDNDDRYNGRESKESSK